MNVLCAFCVSGFYQIYALQRYSPQAVVCHFLLIMVFFKAKEFLSLMKSNTAFFSRLRLFLPSVRNLGLTNPSWQKFCPVFFSRSFIGVDFTFMAVGFCRMEVNGVLCLSVNLSKALVGINEKKKMKGKKIETIFIDVCYREWVKIVRFKLERSLVGGVRWLLIVGKQNSTLWLVYLQIKMVQIETNRRRANLVKPHSVVG